MKNKFSRKIVTGDCIEVLSKVEGPFVDLVFADPPFNIGYKYDKYHDKVEKNNYIHWTKDWMAACKKALKPHGSFYIAIGDDYAANVKVIADELGLFLRNWIIWHYTFGQQTKDKFAKSHTHIFYFAMDKKKFTFNDYAMRVPSDRQLIYNDSRANSVGKMPDDVWNKYSRVCGTFKERAGWHPCQMPESVLRKIIMASSNEGDCVLDPFSGSGTTAAAAIQLNRNYVGVESSKQYADKSVTRLKKLEKESQKKGFYEDIQLKQLLIDTGFDINELVKNEKLLNIFAKQFSVRMNNGKKYSVEEIYSMLKGFKVWF